MRRTQADRMAEAARAQQITEQAQQRVQHRNTVESRNPKAAFDHMMNRPEIMASLDRLKIR